MTDLITTKLLLTLPLILLVHLDASNARQVRLNRYGAQIVEDDKEIDATVRELQPTPYPAAGYRPGRAFQLPTEVQMTTTEASLAATATTTDVNESDSSTTASPTTTDLPSTTLGYTTTDENSISTTTGTPLAPFLYEPGTNAQPRQLKDEAAADNSEVIEAQTPYPAAGYRPSRAFNLPNENQLKDDTDAMTEASQMADAEATTTASANDAEVDPIATKAPYPAAGFRPRCAFHLPNEMIAETPSNSSSAPTNEVQGDSNTATPSNAHHPACGTHTNPLRPKPPAGSVDDPDAVWIVASPATAAFLNAVNTRQLRPLVAVQQRRAQPFIAAVPVARQFIAYSPAVAVQPAWQLQ